MLARCGDALADVLTGRARALDLLFAAAEPSSDVRPAAATSISSVKAATWRRTPSTSAASLRPETASKQNKARRNADRVLRSADDMGLPASRGNVQAGNKAQLATNGEIGSTSRREKVGQ